MELVDMHDIDANDVIFQLVNDIDKVLEFLTFNEYIHLINS